MARDSKATMGRAALAAALASKGWSQADLARELDVEPAVVSRWVSADRVPELRFVLAIQRVFKIEPELWTQEDSSFDTKGAA